MLTQDQQNYFDDLEFTFGTRGWRHLVEEAHKWIYQYQADALEKTHSFEQVMYLRGMAEQLARLIALPDATANERQQLEQE